MWAMAPKLWFETVICALALAACAPSEPRPVEITFGEEACALCRMQISDRTFAAEIVDSDGRVIKFDDIGCSFRFEADGRLQAPAAARFVTGYESKEWLRAEQAWFVRSAGMKTPMTSGIVAFRDRERAADFAGKHNVKPERFDEATEVAIAR